MNSVGHGDLRLLYQNNLPSHFQFTLYKSNYISYTIYCSISRTHNLIYQEGRKKRKARERSKSQHASKKSRNFLHGKIQSPEISATNEIHVQVKRHSLSKLEAPKPLMLPDAWNPSSISLFWSIP